MSRPVQVSGAPFSLCNEVKYSDVMPKFVQDVSFMALVITEMI